MAALPLALLPWVVPPYEKLDATTGQFVPNAGGKMYTYLTDLTTAAPVYQNASGTLVPHTNPVIFDSDGWPPSKAIYVLRQGYSIVVKDSNDVTLQTFTFVEDIGSTVFGTLGNFQASGTTATVSPYTVAATDSIVIVNSATDPFIVQLPTVVGRGTQLLVKNVSAVEVRVTPFGAEEIDGRSAYISLPVAGIPPNPMPAITLYPSTTAWWVASAVAL
jgi:hypothetical protein